MRREQSRRTVLMRGTAALTLPAALVVVPGTLSASPAAMRAAIRQVTGGVEPQTGRVRIEVPPLSENGNTVPITVTVDSPMTESDHVKAIHVFNEKNPQPNVISAWLGPRAGQAMLQTRARLSDTQNIVAVAQLSDGSFWSASANVIVTLGACLEDPI